MPVEIDESCKFDLGERAVRSRGTIFPSSSAFFDGVSLPHVSSRPVRKIPRRWANPARSLGRQRRVVATASILTSFARIGLEKGSIGLRQQLCWCGVHSKDRATKRTNRGSGGAPTRRGVMTTRIAPAWGLERDCFSAFLLSAPHGAEALAWLRLGGAAEDT